MQNDNIIEYDTYLFKYFKEILFFKIYYLLKINELIN